MIIVVASINFRQREQERDAWNKITDWVCGLLLSAGHAHGGIMINIVQQLNGSVTANFTGTVSVVGMAALSNSQSYSRGLNSRNIYTANSVYSVWTVTGSGSPPNLGSMTVDFSTTSSSGNFGFGRWQSSPGIFVPAVFLPQGISNGGSYNVPILLELGIAARYQVLD